MPKLMKAERWYIGLSGTLVTPNGIRDGVCMHDGDHVRPHLVYFAVDIAFGEQCRQRQPVRVDGPAIEIEFQNIFLGDEVGRQTTRHQKAVGIAVVPDRNVAPAVEQAVIRKNAAGSDQILDQFRIRWPGRCRRRLCAST